MATAPVFLPGEPHGQGTVAGYRPWGHKESNTTEATERAVRTHTCFTFGHAPSVLHLLRHRRSAPPMQLQVRNRESQPTALEPHFRTCKARMPAT